MGGKVTAFAFVAIAWVRTIISAFSKNPTARANQRGVHFEMIKIIKMVLLFAEIVSFALIGFCGLLGIIYEIAGFRVFEKVLQSVGISHSLRFVWCVGVISVIVLLGASYTRRRL